uniref:Uncharacterized protein n=1 Tax=Lactuca sativa TaxID=4236 RepID=A0A9R1ULE8_LACSA|nr:hypothetical protein LSAT_V11C800450990 [Lactuca sativa]
MLSGLSEICLSTENAARQTLATGGSRLYSLRRIQVRIQIHLLDSSKYKYLIVRNVSELGCGDELRKLFEGYDSYHWTMKIVSHLLMFTGLSFIRSTMLELRKGSWMNQFLLEIGFKSHMHQSMRALVTQKRSWKVEEKKL